MKQHQRGFIFTVLLGVIVLAAVDMSDDSQEGGNWWD